MFARRLSAPSNMALYLSGVHSYVALFSFQRSSAIEVVSPTARLVYHTIPFCQALILNSFVSKLYLMFFGLMRCKEFYHQKKGLSIGTAPLFAKFFSITSVLHFLNDAEPS